MEQMNIVVVGHVDHGKSTLIGRLLADTHSLPNGKIEQIREKCRIESKTFEYAFLLDALKDEQDQGITITSTRCFFKSNFRDYMIIDAPGHIEFLKNMISGASRAEAALLVIDANEGIQENSRRHGYMLSMLGIKQVVVCVNKMDLIRYNRTIFESIKEKYSKFLKDIAINVENFIPVSALNGENIVENSKNLDWFDGMSVLEALDSFKKENSLDRTEFRMPVQDVYKFTNLDSKRIIAGRIESGTISVGEDVVFLPSYKKSKIKTIEGFGLGVKEISAGFSIGVTLSEQIYIKRGEIMCKESDLLPCVGSIFNANIFWMGDAPLVIGKDYVLRLVAEKTPVRVIKIFRILDASSLESKKKDIVEKYEIAECTLETQFPIAFDLIGNIQTTGRFVIVDGYDIAGGGIITETIEDNQSKLREQVFLREKKWDHSVISFSERALVYGQVPKLVLVTGISGLDKRNIAKRLERVLFEQGRKPYFLGIGNLLRGLDADIEKEKREEHIRRLGEVSHILIDAGLIVIATASDLNDEELRLLQTITFREEMIIISLGKNVINEELVDLTLDENDGIETNVERILILLRFKKIIFNP